MRGTTVAIAIMGLLDICGLHGSAAEPKEPPPSQFSATIEIVKKDRLIVQVTDGVFARAIDVPATGETKIVVNGRPAKLGDLTKGQSVLITVGRDHVTAEGAVRIESQPYGKLVLVKTSRGRLNGRCTEGPIRKESPRWQVILPWKSVRS